MLHAAGHAETSAVLALCEDGVPLHWSRRNHGDFPDSFRQKVVRADGVDACADPFSFQ